MRVGCIWHADTLHKGRVHVSANVNRTHSLRQEPAMEFYYSRRIKREAADRVREPQMAGASI